MADRSPFRPREMLATLESHGVRYMVIGGLAAALHGSAHVTFDVDITPASDGDNRQRLLGALREMKARVRAEGHPDGLEFLHDGRSLSRAGVWNLVTKFGELDLSFVPTGTEGYDDLRRDSVVVDLRGVTVRVASLADVVRSKEAAGRPKDLLALPTLRRLLETRLT